MKYAFFGTNGRIETAHNDDTVKALPNGAMLLTDAQWASRFDLLLSAGSLTLSPAMPLLSSLQAQKTAQIKAAVSAAIMSGVDCDALGAVMHYPSTPTDQQNINGLVTESLLPGAGADYKFWCADSDGAWARRIHTAAQIQAVGMAVSNHIKTQQAKYEQKLAEIAAATYTTIDLITWS